MILWTLAIREVQVDKLENEVADQGGRRSGIDRRQVDIDDAAEEDKAKEPQEERRSGKDRRDGYSYRDDDAERREPFQIK